MSPYLLKELFQQIKRITGRKIAITDQHGQPYKGLSDFPKIKEFALEDSLTRDKACLAIKNYPELQAVPLFVENQLPLLVVLELVPEDIQTIQVITSLGELLIQQFMSAHKPRPDAVDLLLTRLAYRPNTLDSEELDQQIAALGYRLDVQRVALIFELKGFWENYLQTIGQPLGDKKNLINAKKNDIERSLGSFFSRNQDNVVGYIGNDRFLVLKDLSGADFEHFCELLQKNYEEITGSLKNVHIKHVTVSIGSPSQSADELILSTTEALQVLDIGVKLQGPDKAYRSGALGILPLLLSSSMSQKEDYATNLLSSLEEDKELIETLQAFLSSNLNLTQTALNLKVHRNTVIYRLDKIAELLGKDPRQFADAVELHIALQFGKVFPN